MTREEIIQGLQFTIDMFLSDPLTGEPITKPRNDMDKITIDACKGAIELLEQQPCENAISRDDALKALAYDIESFEFKSGVGKHMNEIAKLLNTIYEIQSDNIKALPSVQSKPIECEDAISRAEALKAINKMDIPEDMSVFEIKSHIGVEIGTLPPAQPKIKTGQWVLLDECSNNGYYCSECHKKLVKEGWSNTVKKIKYCPNCGCRMVEPRESEGEK